MRAHKAITKTRLALSASFLFIGMLLVACTPGEQPRETAKIAGQTMGTSYHITIVAAPDQPLEVDTQALKADVDAELAEINQMMSTYIEDSELMRFNRAPVEEWMSLSPPLLEVFDISKRIGRATEGAFDITVGPLVNLWGFGPDMRPEKVPTEDELAAARARVGDEYLQVDATRARRTRDIFVDLSAVAKGYGVDWIGELLSERGYNHYMVEIGGEVRVSGDSPRGTPWRIAIEQPELLTGSARKIIEIDDHAVATSGDYRNYYELDGKRYSHTIDPTTGRPISHTLASVTVVAETAARADAWATALNVLGPEKALALANAEQLAVYMIVKDGDGFSDRQSATFSQLAP